MASGVASRLPPTMSVSGECLAARHRAGATVCYTKSTRSRITRRFLTIENKRYDCKTLQEFKNFLKNQSTNF